MLREALDRMWFCPPTSMVRGATAEALDLLAPTWCVGCRSPGEDLCPNCRADLALLTRWPYRAEGPAEALPILPDLTVLPVLSAAQYTTLVAEAVLTFKDHERIRLVRGLAPALGRAIQAAVELCESGDVLLVWPPSPPRSQLIRGRHPLGELIDGLKLPAEAIPAGHLVRYQMKATDMVKLDRGQKTRSQRSRHRARNRFSLSPGGEQQLYGAEVVLVDDVLTTGATLGNLYRCLFQAGAHVRAAAVLAATPR